MKLGSNDDFSYVQILFLERELILLFCILFYIYVIRVISNRYLNTIGIAFLSLYIVIFI